ncbi:SapC family protein [Teredinibacter sp. KSP-S5-2]|uniref:SapC family protein n=1 Tax=Teredinibacter sp. KSP-S5-2 TaxID=3034506 RepID=UPI0029347CC0|nr:SapC family protein [Teredinibacter sp. KSP-S5-2]WNO09263.1 SapC family protein [Teredinibacter sp. KSP-S5-2]
MSASIVPLSKDNHKHIKVLDQVDTSVVEGQQLVPLAAQEIARAAVVFPVVYVKDANTGTFRLVAMCGLKPGENLFVENGEWLSVYIPAALRNLPFQLGRNEDGDKTQAFVCINENSSLVDDSGIALFEESGDESEFLKSRTAMLAQYDADVKMTEGYISYLVENELLVQKSIALNFTENEQFNLNGIYTIDEEKLAGLSASAFEDMRKRGFLPSIYGHLISLNQIHSLILKRQKKS